MVYAFSFTATLALHVICFLMHFSSDMHESQTREYLPPSIHKQPASRVRPLTRTCVCTCIAPLVPQHHHNGHFCITPHTHSSTLPCSSLGYHRIRKLILNFPVENTVAGQNGTIIVDL
ncbi:uncharacterized protein M421DRAFT_382148 [Didymella exigua CBS 183.55]|uniref:Secreted protein n=1 Tax=Didymella exigua CBS 183.55 TaxID=1150837 RepID=A0A6A5RS75_9PLEO|nr:uncharacterized protein M421DRAFT_382148 [Didymella exigua CBS 183.55]KAF1929988.1 hypothetical protein M421DRAFT_382148 [Didymella exigua CBS 183.55]